MSDLNQHIDNVAKFQPAPTQAAPVVDQSSAANFALDLAARRAAQVANAPQPETVRPLGSMPIPN